MSIFYKRLPPFDYVKPGSLQETLDLLKGQGKGKVMMYAGGTDVIPRIKTRSVPAPELLVDLKGLPDLNYITYDGKGGLKIGALASIFDVAHSPGVREHFSVLAEAASSIASTQIQNRGTIVGNICNAVPSADSAPALLCLGAKAVCKGANRDREIDLQDFFAGPTKTVLEPDELVSELAIPPLKGKGAYF